MADHYVQTVKGPGKTEVETRVYQDYFERYEIDIAADLAAGVYRIPVEAGDTVLNVRVRVKTAADGGTLKVGDGADDDGYLLTTDLTITGAGNMEQSLRKGTESGGTMTWNAYAEGKHYTASGFILFTFATATTGVVVVDVVKAGYPSNTPNYLIANR